ncbi:MAG: hypothetical protein U0174_17535 [Polyangiaceae bacterium]
MADEKNSASAETGDGEKTDAADAAKDSAKPSVKAEAAAEGSTKAESTEAAKSESTEKKTEKKADEKAEPADKTDDDEKAEAKKAGVDDIARRAFALAEETAEEKFEREQEAKLAERRAEAKKAKKKGSLEAAASKKLSDIGTKSIERKKKKAEEEAAEEEEASATAKVYADPLLERTTRLTAWASKNKNVVGYLIAAAVVGLVGSFAYMHFKQQKEGEASAELVSAIAAQRGRVGELPKNAKGEDDESITGPTYKTAAERSDDALKKYKEVQSKFPGTGAAILARLAEGSVHLDKHESDAAFQAFTDVKNSALALADKEVKGRAIEGLGFAQEQKGQNKEALATFKELETTVEIAGFKEVAIYHQARLHEALGEKDKAKELLLSLHERINKPDQPPLDYLKEVVDERLRALDPKAVPQEDPLKGLMGGGGMTPELMKRLQQQMKNKRPGGAPPPPGGGGGGH